MVSINTTSSVQPITGADVSQQPIQSQVLPTLLGIRVYKGLGVVVGLQLSSEGSLCAEGATLVSAKGWYEWLVVGKQWVTLFFQFETYSWHQASAIPHKG